MKATMVVSSYAASKRPEAELAKLRFVQKRGEVLLELSVRGVTIAWCASSNTRVRLAATEQQTKERTTLK